MIRIIACLCLAAVLVAGIATTWRQRSGQSGLDVKFRYLVVSIESPPDWEKKHRFTIQWQGKTVQLPVAFRAQGIDNDFQMGAGAEIFKYLQIGKEHIDVVAQPDTQFHVRNEGGFSIIPEKSTKWGGTSISIATWVTVCPPDQPGEVSPIALKQDLPIAERKIGQRLQDLLDQGMIIDVTDAR